MSVHDGLMWGGLPVRQQLIKYMTKIWKTQKRNRMLCMQCAILLRQISPSVSPSVCLSVCPSHFDIVSKWMHISNSFRLLLGTWEVTKFQGVLLQRGRLIHVVRKMCDFRPKSPFISETLRDKPQLLWITNIDHTRPIDLRQFEQRDESNQTDRRQAASSLNAPAY